MTTAAIGTNAAPRPQRGEVQHLLHVEGDEEERGVEPGQAERLRRVGGGQALDLEDRQRQHGVGVPQLVDDQGSQQRGRAGQLADRGP
jgi:hypothetical protein